MNLEDLPFLLLLGVLGVLGVLGEAMSGSSSLLERT